MSVSQLSVEQLFNLYQDYKSKGTNYSDEDYRKVRDQLDWKSTHLELLLLTKYSNPLLKHVTAVFTGGRILEKVIGGAERDIVEITFGDKGTLQHRYYRGNYMGKELSDREHEHSLLWASCPTNFIAKESIQSAGGKGEAFALRVHNEELCQVLEQALGVPVDHDAVLHLMNAVVVIGREFKRFNFAFHYCAL